MCKIERREEKVPVKIGFIVKLGFVRKGVSVTNVFESKRLWESLRKY